MAVQLFKNGGWQMFDENTFVDRLKEGWSLTEDCNPEEKREIIHNPCGKTVENCDCDNPEVSAVNDEEATIDEIIEAIGCLDEDNTEHWTSGGKPMVVAIETLLGKSIVASQRDEAIERMKVA